MGQLGPADQPKGGWEVAATEASAASEYEMKEDTDDGESGLGLGLGLGSMESGESTR